jgi:alkylation response protein AidB-like acyl-CoA dehydrogenase
MNRNFLSPPPGSPSAETPEQSEMRSSVRRLCEQELPRFQKSDFYNSVPRTLFEKCGALGICGLQVPEGYGGLAADTQTTSIISEELAAADLGPAIFIGVHNMVCGIIANAGSESLKRVILPLMAEGKSLGAFALSEPSAGSDARAMKSHIRIEGDEIILNGEKCYITSGGFADVYVVFARNPAEGPDAFAALVVDAPAPGKLPQDRTGFSVAKPDLKMGCELSPIASLSFDNVRIPRGNLLGTGRDGYRIALSGLARGRVTIASCANGLSRAAIDIASAHLAERTQFDSRLIEFQGLQFMLADMQMQFEAARLLTREAATLLDANPSSWENRLFPSYAKCFATDAAMKITTDAVQLLGGAGYLKDYRVERLMREAKMLQIVEGTNQIQRMVIARELMKRRGVAL